jgi:hypothetical protein
MKKILLATLLGLCAFTQAAGPCKEKRQALSVARTNLRDCNKAWLESIRGQAADPLDDCTVKQKAFVSAVQDIKACIQTAKANK